jgi:hypothetical protein
MTWELNIGGRTIKADLEYHSAQIMRIRVHGQFRTILLETNYPIVTGKKPIKWKLREGELHGDAKQAAATLATIIQQLEYFIKRDFPKQGGLF